jgi:hypothetical protein
MLEEAHRRAERGTDIVIGFVETHGRQHTARMIGDLEVVPRRAVEYRGATFNEMDLDAILRRRPQVATAARNSVAAESFVEDPQPTTALHQEGFCPLGRCTPMRSTSRSRRSHG